MSESVEEPDGMAFKHVNRQSETYYLHAGVTRTGKPKYHFAKTERAGGIDEIPDGYEVYENPDGRVFLRRQTPPVISDAEMALVSARVEEDTGLTTHFILDRKDNILAVYTPDQDPNDLKAEIGPVLAMRGHGNVPPVLELGGPSLESAMAAIDVDKYIEKYLTYSARLRFVLVDSVSRTFQTQRFCYLGGIDDWIDIGSPGALEALAKRYVQHLDKESFYELA